MTASPENTEYLLSVLRAVINGSTAPSPRDGVDLAEVYHIAEQHRLAAMAYHGLYKLGLSDRTMELFRYSQRAHMKRALLAESEFCRISAALEMRGIEYCPIKGWFTRRLYPEPSMRVMHDIDVLIHSEDAPTVKDVMDGFGYECVRFGVSEDDSYRRPGLYVEFHRELDIKEASGADFAHDPWALTVPVSGCMRRLDDSEGYLYTIAHAMKHFASSGTGLRTLIDIYLFLEKAELDRAYIERRADEIGISRFMQCMEKAARCAFGGETPDEDTKKIIDFIISCGISGDMDRWRTSQLVRSGPGRLKGSKASYLLSLLFPSPKKMRFEYKVLFKAPWLLPFTYVARFFSLLFGGKGRLAKGKARFDSLKAEDANALREIYTIAGIKK